MGLIAWWKLDGSTNDSIGTNNGTSSNISWITGKIGQCASLNGTDSYIEIPNSSELSEDYSEFTVACWIKFDQVPSGADDEGYIIQKNDDKFTGTAPWVLWAKSNGIRWRVNDGTSSSTAISSGSYTDGEWHFVAGVWNGSQVILYIEDEIVTSSLSGFENNNGYVSIGSSRYDSTYRPFPGEIDDVRIYDHALSQNEIRELSKAKVAHYSLEGTGKFSALGGTVTTDGDYKIHTFTDVGTHNFYAQKEGEVEVLVVAGGGGGGGGASSYRSGGGGGAGGYQLKTVNVRLGEVIPVTVGDGGDGHSSGYYSGENGGNSSFGDYLISIGGGGGGGTTGSHDGKDGGSGGGGGSNTGTVSAGSGTLAQGNAGGAGTSASPYRGGGGGGANSAGTAGTSTPNGGAGLSTDISGTNTAYAGGGGGADGTSTAGSGGTGGGGNGGTGGGGGQNGTTNTGGGGGGGSGRSGSPGVGGDGGSGIVIIRYVDEEIEETVNDNSEYNNHANNNGALFSLDSIIGGGCFKFNGTGDYVNAGNDLTLRATDNFTVTCRVKTTMSSSSNQYILARYYSTEGKRCWGLLLRANQDYASVIISHSGTAAFGYVDGSTAINDGNWHFLAFKVYDEKYFNIYVDGEPDRADPYYNASFNGLHDNDSSLHIGHSSSFVGYIDDVRIHNAVLSDEEIKNMYEIKARLDSKGNFYIHKLISGYITDGLILNLDAGTYNSYPKTGTTWYDISGNNYNAVGYDGEGGGEDTTNFPVWQSNDSGRFYFDGAKGLNIATSMGDHSEGTHEVWLYRTDLTSASIYIADARNSTGDWWLTNYLDQNINIHNTLRVNDPAVYQDNSNLWDRWIQLVMSSDSSGSKCYVNGIEIVDNRVNLSNSINMNLGTNFRIGCRYTGTGRWKGYISIYRIYDYVLNSEQIWKNFVAIRNRYGI